MGLDNMWMGANLQMGENLCM